MNRVSQMVFSLEHEWILSVGRDKCLQWHSTESGHRLGGHQISAWCLSLQYHFLIKNLVCSNTNAFPFFLDFFFSTFDAESKHIFVGDFSGLIHVLKIEENSINEVTTLKGHSGKRHLNLTIKYYWVFFQEASDHCLGIRTSGFYFLGVLMKSSSCGISALKKELLSN